MENKFSLDEFAIKYAEYIQICNEEKRRCPTFDVFCYLGVISSNDKYNDVDYFLNDLINNDICDMYLQTIILLFLEDEDIIRIDPMQFSSLIK